MVNNFKSFFILTSILIISCNSSQRNKTDSFNQPDSTYIYDTITYVIPEPPFNEYDSIIARKVLIKDTLNPRDWYQFDRNSGVNGCSNVYLQKISHDFQYELLVDLTFDKLPKFKWIDINEYSKLILINFKKYRKGNDYVMPVCQDYGPVSPKPIVKYIAVKGSLNIISWSEEESIVWVILRDLVLQDSMKNEMHLPFEFFEQVRVHWVGG